MALTVYGRSDKMACLKPVSAPMHDLTALLNAWSAGDPSARDQLMTVVYQELRRRAAGQLRGERRGHTLQPTALVHEAYLRLVDQRRIVWQNRGQFFGVACQMMRRILVDRARAHRMAKRSGQWARVTLDEAVRSTPPVDVDVLDLDAALTRLAAFDPRKSQLAELRFFGGLSLQEAGEVVGISMATAERDWQAARAWLLKELRGEDRMTPERWRRVTEVFHAARSHDAATRAQYLDQACAGDRALRDEVGAMLAAESDAGQFGESPVHVSTDRVRRLESGTMVGSYRIDRLIGAGGMGEVYAFGDEPASSRYGSRAAAGVHGHWRRVCLERGVRNCKG